jgi:hypothetical protein
VLLQHTDIEQLHLSVRHEMMSVSTPHAVLFAEAVAIATADASLARDAPRAAAEAAEERTVSRVIESAPSYYVPQHKTPKKALYHKTF